MEEDFRFNPELSSPDSLVSQFKFRHQAIVNGIDQVKLYLRSYSLAKPKLRELYEVLLSHFEKQNKQLFDRLHEYYSGDKESIKLLEFLLHDLKDVKIKFLIFSEEYTGEMGDAASPKFPKEFMDFASVLLGRIHMEEDYFFPLLEKLP